MDTSVVVEAAPQVSPTQSHYLVSIQLVAQTRKGLNCLKNVKVTEITENLHPGMNKILQ